MHSLSTELRHAWRSLVRRKAYFITCALTLTLVLGANAAVFAVVNATMLRPLPFVTDGAVVQLFAQPPGTTSLLQRNPLQQMEVPRLRERARTLRRVEGFYVSERVVTLGGEPAVVQSAAITPGLLEMMGAPVATGRSFAAREGEPGHLVALVTHHYWRDTLGSASVLGSSLIIDNQPHTVVGVLAPEFRVPFLPVEVLTPLVASPEPVRAPPRSVVALAELAPGVSIEQVRGELAGISAALAQEFPRTHSHWRLGAEHARDWQYGSMRAPLMTLLAATALVLVIACVNIANLTSAQAMARSSERALRVALGASTGDVWRGDLSELLLVCLAGLVPGLLLAHLAVPALLAMDPTVAQSIGAVSIDWRVQVFSLAMATTAALLALGIASMRGRHADPAAAIGVTTVRTTGSPRAIRVQRALVSLEVGLCVALLMAGAVLIQGLRELSERGPGYDATRVLTAQIRLPEASYSSPERRAATVTRMLDAIGALPGVLSVGLTQNAFIPGFSYQTLLRVKDAPAADDQPHTVQYRRVSPDYFRSMQIPVLSGRAFEEADTSDRPPVAIISRRFAETLLPAVDPLGRQLLRNNQPPVTIVGVVDDAADVTVTAQAEPTFYVPWAQNNNFGVPVAFVIRTSVDPNSLVPAVRQTVRTIDASLPLRKPQPLAVFVRESTAPERFRSTVLSILAALGVVLASIGIAGVTYRGVVDRSRDFAVRLALGAGPGGVMRLVVGESARDLLIGVAVGVTAGTFMCAALARLLNNVAPVDPVVIGVVVITIAAVGIVAATIPALRTLSVHPAEVLRA